MRTARYRIICTRNAARYGRDAGAWSGFGKLETLCRSLSRDGFQYETTVTAISEDRIMISVAGTAGRAKKTRKHCRRVTLPPPVTVDKCRKKAAESKRAAIRSGLIPERRRCHPWGYREETRRGDRRIGRVIARAIAQGRDTVTFDELYGHGHGSATCSVPRLIEERKNDWRETPKALAPITQESEARRAALREYEYWREMEALSGQREQWKPGLTDATYYGDDEVQTRGAA